jgi:rhodanese-related sulfurtransferase
MEAPLEITVEEAARLVQPSGDALLLDVREPDEWAFCHVAGSRHLPMRQVPESLADLPRDRPILVLCHHGSRSMRVTQFLRAHGYPLASSVADGIEAWAEKIDPALPRY